MPRSLPGSAMSADLHLIPTASDFRKEISELQEMLLERERQIVELWTARTAALEREVLLVSTLAQYALRPELTPSTMARDALLKHHAAIT